MRCARTVVLALLILGLLATAATARESMRLDGMWEEAACTPEPPPPSTMAMVPVPVPSVNTWLPDGPHTVWYRTKFLPPPGWRGERVVLRLNGVKYSQRVYLNGQLVGRHTGGFEPTEYDITDRVSYTAHNELLIAADDWLSLLAPGTTVPAGAPVGTGVKNALLAPLGSAGDEVGIWGSVFVEAHPRVWIEDVLVMPSVREGVLRVRVTVRNAGENEERVIVTGRIADGGPGPRFEPFGTRLAPNSEQVVTLQANWPDAHLWTPDDPHLYTLVVGSVAGAKVDSQTVRFGFREFGVEGDTFLLNCTPIHLLGAHAVRPQLFDQDPVATLKAAKASGVNVVRLGGEPWPEEWYDAADETGVLVVAESALWDMAPSCALATDAFWTNANDHVAAVVHHLRNHPSVVMWSAEDELLASGGASVTRVAPKVAALSDVIRKVDPTRPVMFEGDFNPDGKAEATNLHRPHELPRWRNWPETAFWFDAPAPLDNYPKTTWQWGRERPLVLGQFLETPPDQVHTGSIFFGDEAYPEVDAARLRADAVARDWQIIAARDAGVSGLSAWDLEAPLAIEQRYFPVAAFDLSANSEMFAGTTVTRRLSVLNDSDASRNLTLRVRVAPADNAWQVTGEVPLTLAAGGRQRVGMDLPLPALAAAVTEAEFVVEVWEGDRRLYGGRAEWRVFGRKQLSESIAGAARHVASYDPVGDTTRMLAQFDITPEPITAENLDRALRWADTVVIGKGAFTAPNCSADTPLLKAVLDYARRGGRVLVFEQTAYPEWFAPISLSDRDSTMTFVRAVGHPAVEGLEDRDLAHWLPDGFASRREIRKFDRVGFRTLVDSGGADGLETAALAELAVGEGRLVLCQLDVTAKAGFDAAATQVVRNLLVYAAKRPSRAGATGVLVDPATASALRAVGLNCAPVTPSFPRGRLDYNLLILSNPTADQLQADAARLRSFVRSGGRVLLHDITPQNADAVAALVGQPVSLTPSTGEGVHLVERTGPAEGISNQEFAWFLHSPTAPASALSPAIATNFVDLPVASGTVVYTRPGVLASIRSGRGLWVIDQVRWDNPQGYDELARRYLAALLTNLGAEGVPAPPAAPDAAPQPPAAPPAPAKPVLSSPATATPKPAPPPAATAPSTPPAKAPVPPAPPAGAPPAGAPPALPPPPVATSARPALHAGAFHSRRALAPSSGFGAPIRCAFAAVASVTPVGRV